MLSITMRGGGGGGIPYSTTLPGYSSTALQGAGKACLLNSLQYCNSFTHTVSYTTYLRPRGNNLVAMATNNHGDKFIDETMSILKMNYLVYG